MNIGPFFLPSFSLLPTNTWIYSSQTKAQRPALGSVVKRFGIFLLKRDNRSVEDTLQTIDPEFPF
jgi:hypothetical protein